MKTKTYNTYSFAELSAKAKDAARQSIATDIGYAWADEALESLSALAVHFGGKLKDYQIDWFASSYCSADFDMPDMEEADIAAKLAALGTYDPVTFRGHGDCKLTGFCADESAIDGFRKAWHAGERDLGKLMQAAFREWLKDAQADCAGQYEDENLADFCETNDYEFTAEGDID